MNLVTFLYKERYPQGSRVKVRSREALLEFQRSWTYHHPLSDDMLALAGRVSSVLSVGYYHGGDVLYQLDQIAGTWHESCLEAVTE